ncbi:alkyl sulfatase BDS1-like metallo-beta-lactamase superfamily hydrolase [Novosphingobium kunmingense]|uniref:Alkyl sulfatase BDS1-like metallo-beta-lactamase superfamily hydrolase n=1 Tax=Novosphingobium kunmingense TaxID=1211806 RepID=A0A2N0I367_9SPHN|nr:alkyl sulfatase dimerization domain-containing protein [Novosphingobium kunmingense]PKB25610.1 alkyl sulfatase BDS1-like metallo-beta-lactamase superfamily hydrolase [Novosphingobium kunmingense]
MKPLSTIVGLAALAAGPALAGAQTPEGPKPASPATVARQAEVAASLPAEDGRDADYAARGFVATRTDPVIAGAQGRTVWRTDAYAFVEGPAPATVNPSLWREMKHLKAAGLYAVADGVWQVRGFDVSNMTVVRGATGWIVVDPLTTRETAAAALELVNAQLGKRPVSAVIYSHSHADHFGGVRGVIDELDAAARKVPIIAPARFTEEAASENIMAGAAMGRRANYQFGAGIAPGPQGQMGSGIGMGVAAGEITLIAPTDLIEKTGETRTIDGIALEFQIVSGSEAPSELNVYVAPARAFLSAEMSTCSLHNILTPRGAKVRDTHAWAGFLDEALRLYGGRSDVVLSSHCWPRFGQAEVAGMLASQRDNYRYLHDQSVRRMNQGAGPAEVAEGLTQPAALAAQWYNHGYYGTYSHNSKAVYQFYLGWYDANPANLDPWPPVERATRYVAALGGARKVIALARKAMASGDYRWSSDLLNQVVFADAANRQARALLADSYEQQGYQAESGIWRNQFLSAARDLRQGYKPGATNTQSADLIAAVPTQLLLDSVATRFDSARFSGHTATINLVMPERRENAGVELTGTTMFARMTPQAEPDVTITAPRRLVLGLLFLKLPLAQLEAAGLKIEGNRDLAQKWLDAIDPLSSGFNIAEP